MMMPYSGMLRVFAGLVLAVPAGVIGESVAWSARRDRAANTVIVAPPAAISAALPGRVNRRHTNDRLPGAVYRPMLLR